MRREHGHQQSRRTGNTASTSYFVALAEGIRSDRIRSGDTILFSITGSGLTVGTALYTLDDLPDRLRGGSGPHEVAVAPAPPTASTRRVRITGLATSEVDLSPSDMDDGRADSATLALRAVRGALADARRAPGEIGLLLYAGMYRSELLYEPAMAAMIAGAADMNADAAPGEPTTLAFDVFGGGVGFLDACQVAARMLSTGTATAALVAMSEVDHNAGIDGATALGVSEVGSAAVLETSAGAEGFGTFAHRYLADSLDALAVDSFVRDGHTVLRVQRDPVAEERYLEVIPEVVQEALEREGITMDSVALYLPPQHSSAFIARLAKQLGVSPDRMVDVARTGSDLFTSGIAYALRDARARSLVNPGDVGVMICVGAGLRVSCATYHF